MVLLFQLEKSFIAFASGSKLFYSIVWAVKLLMFYVNHNFIFTPLKIQKENTNLYDKFAYLLLKNNIFQSFVQVFEDHVVHKRKSHFMILKYFKEQEKFFVANKCMKRTRFLYAEFKRKHHEYKEFFIYVFLRLYKGALCKKFHEVNTFLYHWNRGMLFQKQKIKFTTHLCFELIYRNILPVQWWRIKDVDLSEKITENVIQCSHWKWEKVTKECVK